MDLEAVRIFVRVAELRSFTRAGEQLGLSKARASIRVRELEAEIGARLLHRSTRAVQLTEDGERFLIGAQALVRDAEELGAIFQAPTTVRGRVRIDLPIRLARDHVFPRLPELLAANPQLELLISTTDHRVDPVREGFDCVLRVGALRDSGLVAKRLGVLRMVNCASPAYLRRYGVPTALDDLDRHVMVCYAPTFGGDPSSFEWTDGTKTREKPMRSLVTVNGTDAFQAACAAGLGIIQVPLLGVRASLVNGDLVEVLPLFTAAPMPVSLVQTDARARKPVRAVMAWLAQIVTPHLG